MKKGGSGRRAYESVGIYATNHFMLLRTRGVAGVQLVVLVAVVIVLVIVVVIVVMV